MNLTVRGVTFALFPQYDQTDPRGREMVEATVKRLQQLDEERPEVILMPEPENVKDPKAIRVYCEGSPIGYVAHEQTDTAHLLFDTLHPIVPARIVGVDAESKRHFYIEAEMSEDALRKQFAKSEKVNAWKDWRCSFPKLPMPEVWKNCQVLEFQIEQEFPVQTLEQVRNLKTYIKLWIDRSLHDFSVEAMQLRQRYIDRLRSVGNGAFDAEVKRLEKQYAAICSGQRMTYRMKWWKELQHSASMEHYWDQWRSSRREDNLWKDLYTVDSQLRRMPDGLYAHIGDLTSLFAALRYRDDVTREVLWDIYTLLLLRERLCRELGVAMKPLPMEAYGVEDEEESFVPELTDARLAKAVEECQPFFWAKSAWAVVFCVCRDYFGVTDNVSAFEKRVQGLVLSDRVKKYVAGTIYSALCNNAFLKKPISRWAEGRALVLAKELKAVLEGSTSKSNKFCEIF